MKTIFGYLKAYLKEHFQWNLYLVTTVFLAILVYFNFKYDFEDSVIDSYYGNWIRIPMFFLFHAVPYYIVCVFIYWLKPNITFLKNPKFWIWSAVGFVVLALDRGAHYHKYLAEYLSNSYTETFIYRFIENFVSIVYVVIPLLLVYFLFHRKTVGHFYGIRLENVNLKPYWVMLAIMVPLIALASSQSDFLVEYPNLKRSGYVFFAQKMEWSEGMAIGLFEVSYAFGFFIVELVFRGYLIFALVKYMGKEVVLPMAVTYCVLHFGKPLGEAISSYFGGYLLGLIALKTENIYGGIMVHIGIALLMELFAFYQFM